MSISQKNTYRILLITGFIVLNSLLLLGIGEIYSFLNSGASKASIFHGDLEGEIDYHPEISWDSLNCEGGPLSIRIVRDVIDDYKVAWFVRNNALFSGDEQGIDDMFTQSAREKIRKLIAHNKEQGISVETTTLAHHLQFDLVSADGKLVAFTDREVRSHSRLWEQENRLGDKEEIASYRVVMLLEDGFWRIRHMRKFDVRQPQPPSFKPLPMPDRIEGINYYPQQTPWNTFGEGFDPEVIGHDLDKLRALKMNTVRIFVSYNDFGGAQVHSEKLQKLERFLDLAVERELRVVVTLFDFYGDYSVRDWSSTRRHARLVVEHLRDHPALWSWDIKNEPDLDFDHRGKEVVILWLEQMARHVKAIDPTHGVTVGWSSGDAALSLEEPLDYVSFHFYEDLGLLQETVDSLRGRTTKPIVLQEFGLSSDFGLWNLFGKKQRSQAEYYEKFLKINQGLDLHYLPWTLYDFEEVPSSVGGISPWVKNKQSHFGLIDREGNEKESFQVMRQRD